MSSVAEVLAADLPELAAHASTEALRLAAQVLREDADNQRWRAQVGPCLTQGAVASLLHLTPQGVAKRAGSGDLLRLTNADGRPAYPVFQFQGRGVLDGIAQVVEMLSEVDDGLTIASWLTVPKRALSGETPVAALRHGQVGAVLAAAANYLARSS